MGHPTPQGVTVKNGTPNGHWGFWKRMCTKLKIGLDTIFGHMKMTAPKMATRPSLSFVHILAVPFLTVTPTEVG
jgi:hypothetical protein